MQWLSWRTMSNHLLKVGGFVFFDRRWKFRNSCTLLVQSTRRTHKILKEERELSDVFGGVTLKSVDLKQTDKEVSRFADVISESLKHWKSKHVKGVWIKVDIKDSHIIPVLVDNGFVFHHAQPNYVMMTKWLPDTLLTLPRYAHTVIGAGGIVVDEKGRILLMREKRGYYLGWKFPGGASDPGESIFETAAREVLEETGVSAVGKALLCIRQINASQYENVGDIYFVVLMDAIDQEIRGCPSETADCRWFTRDELDALPDDAFRIFSREILRRYDLWKVAGRKGCHIVSCQFTSKKCKMFYID